jgi:hypothetical protein
MIEIEEIVQALQKENIFIVTSPNNQKYVALAKSHSIHLIESQEETRPDITIENLELEIKETNYATKEALLSKDNFYSANHQAARLNQEHLKQSFLAQASYTTKRKLSRRNLRFR